MRDAIDESELVELEAALGALDEAYVRVEQAARRILILSRMQRDQAPAHSPRPRRVNAAAVEEARARGFTGNACGRCGAVAMLRTGTCETCQECGYNVGCS